MSRFYLPAQAHIGDSCGHYFRHQEESESSEPGLLPVSRSERLRVMMASDFLQYDLVGFVKQGDAPSHSLS